MKNINFSYEENKNNIKYNEYYFNGIFVPKNIEFKDISNTSLNLSWNIDNINIINIEKNKIKYIVEMRKENEKFEKVYEGKNNICSVNNLNNNTNYEFKICSLYNDLIGECTDIQKIKTKDIIQKSNLLDNSPEFLQFKFKPGDNYTLNDNGLISTKTGGNYSWNCTIIGDREISKNKITKFKIKINDISQNSINSWNILVGIGPENINKETNHHRKCFSFICGDSELYLKNKIEKYNDRKGKIKKGDIIEVVLDRKLGNLSFSVNGVNYGIATNQIPQEDKLYPIINMYDVNQSIEILND